MCSMPKTVEGHAQRSNVPNFVNVTANGQEVEGRRRCPPVPCPVTSQKFASSLSRCSSPLSLPLPSLFAPSSLSSSTLSYLDWIHIELVTSLIAEFLVLLAPIYTTFGKLSGSAPATSSASATILNFRAQTKPNPCKRDYQSQTA